MDNVRLIFPLLFFPPRPGRYSGEACMQTGRHGLSFSYTTSGTTFLVWVDVFFSQGTCTTGPRSIVGHLQKLFVCVCTCLRQGLYEAS